MFYSQLNTSARVSTAPQITLFFYYAFHPTYSHIVIVNQTKFSLSLTRPPITQKVLFFCGCFTSLLFYEMRHPKTRPFTHQITLRQRGQSNDNDWSLNL